ncbi:MAG TPA: hypothetical protein VIF14_14570 [Alphaproteobacteria bacterium]|jgi:hypothetical protein
MTPSAKPASANFLGGAKSRLLPASIPFRFFGGAVFFHFAFWLGVIWAAPEVPNFVAGPGRVLAVLHLLTLGVFAATAFGAAFQLLPVATKQPLRAEWPARLVAWLLFAGLTLFAPGMAETLHIPAALGALLAAAGVVLAAALLADNLARARGMAGVVAHGWAAMASLAAIAALGFLLVLDQYHGILPSRLGIGTAHAILAVFGFMGMLALGFSYVLVPMFGLAPAPSERAQLASFTLAVAGLALGVAGALLGEPWLIAGAAAGGLGAVALYLRLMAAAMQARMRKRLGPSFLLVRAAWACLPLSLILGALTALDLWPWRGPALFGALALLGWLLTFVLGMLQRIVPFLASMHATAPGRAPPLVSSLTAERPLAIHRYCHFAAVAGVIAGIAGDWPLVIEAAGAVGAAGAAAFAWFFIGTMARIRRAA